MTKFWQGTMLIVGLGLGYLAGLAGALEPVDLAAQGATDELKPETQKKLKTTYETAQEAAQALKDEKRYETATEGVNLFAVSVGGLNVLDDLEKGRGVDPETFAALYAGLATNDIQEHIERDSQGRVTYKGKVVQMYPIRRLTQLFKERLKYSGEEVNQ